MKNLIITALLLSSVTCSAEKILKVGVAGLSHDHVNGLMQQYKRGEVVIAVIAEGDEQLAGRYKKTFQLPDSLFLKALTTY
jgi:hypothetical protein